MATRMPYYGPTASWWPVRALIGFRLLGPAESPPKTTSQRRYHADPNLPSELLGVTPIWR